MKVKLFILSTLTGALIMFFWGATEWFNPLLHLPYKTAANPEQVNQTLNTNMPENGIYLWPNGVDTKTQDGKAKDIVYFIAKNNASFYNPAKFMPVELLTQLLIWFFITYILNFVNFTDYRKRIKLIMIVGILVGLTFFLPLWNWWGFSTSYVIIRWANMMIGWFLSSLAVSYVFKKYSQQQN